jgi:hypothetical protein
VNWRLDLVRLVIDGQSEGHGVTPNDLSTKPGQPHLYPLPLCIPLFRPPGRLSGGLSTRWRISGLLGHQSSSTALTSSAQGTAPYSEEIQLGVCLKRRTTKASFVPAPRKTVAARSLRPLGLTPVIRFGGFERFTPQRLVAC